MKIVELTINEFDEFAANHPLRNYCQTSFYAKLMGEKGFSYDYIGYKDNGILIATSLILYKKIGSFFKYAYAPKGFLIDYYNMSLLKNFIKDLAHHYNRKGVVFIKINPEIIIGEYDNNNFIYNQNVKIIDQLKELGFKRRKERNQLELLMPKYSAYINLKEFKIINAKPEYKNIIESSIAKGLVLENGTSKDVNIFFNMLNDRSFESINFFRNVLNSFNNENSELLFIKVNYEQCLINARTHYDEELAYNEECNEKIQKNNNEKNLNEKMESDRKLLKLKSNIVEATEGLKNFKNKCIGSAIIIKYQNRVSIIGCAFLEEHLSLLPEYYFYSALIEKYKEDYDFLELGAVTADFSNYKKFNEVKLAFNPSIFEFIGEFDYIINELSFRSALSKDLLSKEFMPMYSTNIGRNTD